MTRRAREIETLLLAMYAAVPLYLTQAIQKAPLIAFHVVMGLIVARLAMGRTPELIPMRIMRWIAVAYFPFYFVDWRFIAGTAIAASTHLVLFIAIYQPIESMHRNNQAQRMLTTALIFVASLATSTHITVTLFVLGFAFLMFRQLMYVSHLETVRAIGARYDEPPSAKTAAFYLGGAVLIAALLFPLLPRVRDPLVQGGLSALPGATTALSETINFNQPRVSSGDTAVVARVWMNEETRDLFGALRLRGTIYDRYSGGEWRQRLRGLREVPGSEGSFTVARPGGEKREAIVQIRAARGKLFLPVGTYQISGHASRLYEGPTLETFYTYHDGPLNMTVRVATETEPLRLTRVAPVSYPLTPQVMALAQSITGDAATVEEKAERIQKYMLANFAYLANDVEPSRSLSIDEFLLRDRRGHCEHFAAGMVVLLTALDIPARMVGGFYGARQNPLTGYYTIRWEDAHAWTEVWTGSRWATYDSTPPLLRPGVQGRSRMMEYLAAIGDSLTFLWDRYILTFGLGDQLQLLEDILTSAKTAATAWRARVATDLRNVTSAGYIGVYALLVVAGFAVVILARRRRPLFDVLARHLSRRGISVGPATTMEEALQQLAAEQPEAARELAPLIALYEEERFSPRQDKARVKLIRRRVAELRT